MTPWRRCLAAALLLGALCPAPTARAAERLLEDFATPGRYAPAWQSGALREGRDEDLHWLELTAGGRPGQPEVVLIANREPYQPALDLRGRFLKLWIRVDDLARLGGMEFRLASQDFDQGYFAFGFTRYADLDSNIVREGVWNVLTLPFASARVVGRPDRSAIRRVGWYVSDQGTGPVKAWWGGLAAVDEPAEGVVSFTFDDGYAEHYWAAERMAKYGMRGTAYVIPSGIDKPGYLSSGQLAELEKRFGWEVAAHHETPLTDFAPAELEGRLLGVQRFLGARGFARGALHLAYPLGRQNPARVRPVARALFTSARVAGGGLETLPPADRHLLRVFNVVQSTRPEEVAEAARQARLDRHWLILMFHFLVERTERDTEYRRSDFEKLLALVQETGARVSPLIEVFEACGELAGEICRLPSRAAAPAP